VSITLGLESVPEVITDGVDSLPTFAAGVFPSGSAATAVVFSSAFLFSRRTWD
jgi:hypothetical protein